MKQLASSNSIHLTEVSRSFVDGGEERFAVRSVSLDIKGGEFVAIRGPSGSGKTTLLHLISGLDVPSSGKIIVGGQDLGLMSERERANFRLNNIGFVFQSYNLIPVLSAEENVAFVQQLRGVSPDQRKKRARELLDKVGLSGLENRRPHQLSGGQQQRVAIARALASHPVCVLADEPTANLDRDTAHKLMLLMEDLNLAQGVTFIFSTHDDLVLQYAKRIITLADGSVVSMNQG
ncbi:MAG TPA: ABC transporter ATP-binding protein [Oligoflexia bacterium]|nr:ABC transporter ATP-binding protein [Oligoflexia bacterium]HMP48079.1 ABC transporter ATP-binding protein [Oligoflexia bacterium]